MASKVLLLLKQCYNMALAAGALNNYKANNHGNPLLLQVPLVMAIIRKKKTMMASKLIQCILILRL